MISKQLTDRKEKPNRKPLILRGARQVGKTYSITQFGENAFTQHVKVDFEKQRELRKIFEGDLSPNRLIQLIELEANVDIVAAQTLLFLD